MSRRSTRDLRVVSNHLVGCLWEDRITIQGREKVARREVRPTKVRSIEAGLHGEWWIRVLIGFHDLTGIDSSALGDGKSQRMHTGLSPSCNPLPKSAWPGRREQPALPVNADWTGQTICPFEKCWRGESDLHTPFREADRDQVTRCALVASSHCSASRNRFTIDRVR